MAHVELAETVTVGGWYRTVDGRWAEIAWREQCRAYSARHPCVVRVADQPESREEERAREAREWAEQEAS
jgi:hypothetical protein